MREQDYKGSTINSEWSQEDSFRHTIFTLQIPLLGIGCPVVGYREGKNRKRRQLDRHSCRKNT